VELVTGNCGDVTRVSEFEYDIAIRGDTNSPKHSLWFYFRVRNAATNQRAILHIHNYSKSKALFRDGLTPLVRSTSRWNWERLPAKQCLWFRCPRHRKRNCLTILFQFDRADDDYYFALSFPYSYTRLQKYLHSIESLGAPYLRRELLCRTTQDRRLDLLTITSAQNFAALANSDAPASPLRHVVITARVHPGETPASFVCQGIIDFLMSEHPLAKVLRDNVVFLVIPMLNPDGVALGNYRCSSMGLDLNRQWLAPEDWCEPTIASTKALLVRLAQDPRVSLDVFIDVHAHTMATVGFMYLNGTASPAKNDVSMLFPKLLDQHSRDFNFAKCKQCSDPGKKGTGRRVMGDFLQNTCCYTLEVSFWMTIQNGVKGEPFTELSYLAMGRAIGITFVDFYKLLNDNPPQPPKSAPAVTAIGSSIPTPTASEAIPYSSGASTSASLVAPQTLLASHPSATAYASMQVQMISDSDTPPPLPSALSARGLAALRVLTNSTEESTSDIVEKVSTVSSRHAVEGRQRPERIPLRAATVQPFAAPSSAGVIESLSMDMSAMNDRAASTSSGVHSAFVDSAHHANDMSFGRFAAVGNAILSSEPTQFLRKPMAPVDPPTSRSPGMNPRLRSLSSMFRVNDSGSTTAASSVSNSQAIAILSHDALVHRLRAQQRNLTDEGNVTSQPGSSSLAGGASHALPGRAQLSSLTKVATRWSAPPTVRGAPSSSNDRGVTDMFAPYTLLPAHSRRPLLSGVAPPEPIGQRVQRRAQGSAASSPRRE
jgi:hypothetical protein